MTMGSKKKVLGIVTARGGSKRIPRKNIKEFLGKPLLAWTIDAGKKSGVLDRFVLTTDDAAIAALGKEQGIEVPFLRPPELASDTATSFDAVYHTAQELKRQEGFDPDWIVLLEPTSPSRLPLHIKEVVDLIQRDDDVDSIIGLSHLSPHYSYLKEFVLDEKGVIRRVVDNAGLKSIIHRNQEVPRTHYINSLIYAFKTKNLYDGSGMLWGESTRGYLIDPFYAVDIDTPEDWELAEFKMRKILERHPDLK